MTLDIQLNPDIQAYHLDALTPHLPTLSVSVAKEMLRSPKHGWAKHPRFGGHPKPITMSMKLGTIIDEVMTNQERRLGLVPFADYRTKEAKAYRDRVAAEGKVPVKQAELDAARERAASVTKNLTFHGIDLEPMQKQVLVLWEEKASNGNPVQCRALLDYLSSDCTTIRDLKSTKDCRPGELLGRKALGFGYHIQAAAYTSAIEHIIPKLAGRVRFENIWIEEDWPHEPCITMFGGDAMQLGRMQWQRAVDLWESCLITNKWPGYQRNREAHVIELPAYMAGEMFTEDEEADEEGGEDEDL